MVVGVLGAMEDEVRLVRDALVDRRDEVVFGAELHRGTLDGHDVVLARSGVGKVNAALTTAALVVAGVDAVLFTGVAGGAAPGVRVGDVVVATDLVQHDIDVTALGHQPGELLGQPLAWACDTRLFAVADAASRQAVGDASVHAGRIASGDQFIASEADVERLHRQFGCLAVEMEGAAVAQACVRLGLPFVVVRSISDEAGSSAHVDFPAFLTMAAPRGLTLVRAFLAGLTSNRAAS